MMKRRSVLQVLGYLFQHHLIDGARLRISQQDVVAHLTQAEFSMDVIYQTFEWLNELLGWQHNEKQFDLPSAASFRLYNVHECVRLDSECRNYLLFLERCRILDATRREQVIDRLLSLGGNERLTIQYVKMVTLIVLSVHVTQRAALSAMERLVLEEPSVNGVH
jgi:Smg protein